MVYFRLLFDNGHCVRSCVFDQGNLMDLKSHRCVNCVDYKCFLDITKYPIIDKNGSEQIADKNLCGNAIVEETNFEECDPGLT